MAAVTGALERKTWIKVSRALTYPNLYVLLVGGPGVGKSQALRRTVSFWTDLPDLHVAPDSVSRASLADELQLAERQVLQPLTGVFDKFNALAVCASEFGTFLSQYEGEFMSTLNHLYDGDRYKEKKRSMKEAILIEKPHLNIVAATTPAWLSTSLPESAWAEGFASRLILVFSAERAKIDLWGTRDTDSALEKQLHSDINSIHKMYGQYKWEEEVQSALQAWVDADCPPKPDHSKLEHYLPRRPWHLLKLTMIMSAARSSELVIRMIDYQRAMDLFLETEATMPDVFRSMKNNSDSGIIDEVYNWIWQTYAKTKKGLPEHLIIHFLSERAPSYAVMKMLDVMIQSNMITVSDISGPGGRPLYKPSPKAAF